MALFIDVLKDKYNINTKLDKENSENKKDKNEIKIKKSGLFTGLKSSQTYQKNHLQHIVNHTLNKNKDFTPKLLKLTESISLSQLIEESFLIFENTKSVVYRKNIKTPQGTNKLAFPHSAVAKTISKKTPSKPKDGIAVSTIFNRVGLYKKHIQDLKTIPKLFQNKEGN